MPQLGEIRQARELGKKGYYKYIWHGCIDCGKERWVLAKGKGCSLPRSLRCYDCGTRKALWKGGRRVDARGYVSIYLYPYDFFFPMARCDNCVVEHRLVMARHLNRCLLPWEIVHHKNGIKGDNRLENLQLLPNSTYHAVDNKVKAYIKRLENEISKLRSELDGIKDS